MREAGFDAIDVRDAGLRGCSDDAVRRYAREDSRVVVTGDLAFGNILDHPPGSHAGVVLARFANEDGIEHVCSTIIAALRALSSDDIES